MNFGGGAGPGNVPLQGRAPFEAVHGAHGSGYDGRGTWEVKTKKAFRWMMGGVGWVPQKMNAGGEGEMPGRATQGLREDQ